MNQTLQNVVHAWMWWRPLQRCVVCGAVADRRRSNLMVCRDCFEASRPHAQSDPYDELGGGD